jgi:hypothetical protein
MARKRIVLVALLSLTLGGCMLPVYHEPGGYSSTWRKRMRESNVDWPEPIKDSEIAGLDLPDTSGVGNFFSSVKDACQPTTRRGESHWR